MAVAFTWTGYVDTDLDFAEFFDDDHSLSMRFMPQYQNGYEGPCFAENGEGTFVLGQGCFFKHERLRTPRLYLAVGEAVEKINVALEAGRWYHLAMVARAVRGGNREFTLYLDGKARRTLTIGGGMAELPKGKVRFGKRTNGKVIDDRNAQFYGLLADVGVFTRALNENEILALAGPGKKLTGSESGLLAGYSFSGGRQPTKLSRPITVHPPATIVETSPTGSNTADAALLLEPAAHHPMDLPFPPGEAWRTGQEWNSGPGSHNGLAAFCWDLTVFGPGGAYPNGTAGAPVYAAASGEVVTVRNIAPSGDNEYGNYVDIRQGPEEYATYMHLQQMSTLVQTGDSARLGQVVGLAGDTGTTVGNFHFHFAVNDKPDGINGFVTIPVAFSDYQVHAGDDEWTNVARGVPRGQQTIRNPPTPKFGPGSLDPSSVVSRAGNLLDLVATDIGGQVWLARWTPGRYVKNWDRWRPLLGDVGSTRPVGVVSRSPGRIDIVNVGNDGRIRTGAWNQSVDRGLWHGWWLIKDHVGKPNAPVAIVSRDPGKLDVFAVREDGAISTAAWDSDIEGGAWRGWWSVAGGSTAPLGWVTAVARTPQKLDLFMVGHDGGVYTAAWDQAGTGGWRGWWKILDLVARPGSRIAAVARDAGKLDIFVVREDGVVSTAAWDHKVANGAWRGWWSVAGLTTFKETPVTAVSRGPGKLDVFVVGSDSGVHTAAWDQNVAGGKWRGPWQVGDLVAHPRSVVAAVSREPEKLDIFAIRDNGEMSTAAWDLHAANGQWQGWWKIG